MLALLAPVPAAAQLQPHRADYVVRLGVAPDAPRIGSAMQELTRDCAGWHLVRSSRTEIALTPGVGLSTGSRLDGEETRQAFRYSATQTQNGLDRRQQGKVQRQGGEMRAEIVAPGAAPHQLVLPPPTLLPVAALSHLVERLRAGGGSFPAVLFDAEVTGDALSVTVAEQPRDALRGRPSGPRVDIPGERSWPVRMTFSRARRDDRPLFTVTALVFDSGVLDRLTIDTGLLTLAADLQAFAPRPMPACPKS